MLNSTPENEPSVLGSAAPPANHLRPEPRRCWPRRPHTPRPASRCACSRSEKHSAGSFRPLSAALKTSKIPLKVVAQQLKSLASMLAMCTNGPWRTHVSKGTQNMEEKYHLFADGQSSAQGHDQSDKLGDQRPQGEVLLEDNAAEDGLHLGNARAWNGRRAGSREGLRLAGEVYRPPAARQSGRRRPRRARAGGCMPPRRRTGVPGRRRPRRRRGRSALQSTDGLRAPKAKALTLAQAGDAEVDGEAEHAHQDAQQHQVDRVLAQRRRAAPGARTVPGCRKHTYATLPPGDYSTTKWQNYLLTSGNDTHTFPTHSLL